MPRAHYIGQVSVSPDGSHYAWVDEGSNLVISVRKADGKPDQTRKVDIGEDCRAQSFTWAPDSASIAFFAECGKSEQVDLYLADALNDYKSHRLTELKGYVQAPAFSPDGKPSPSFM